MSEDQRLINEAIISALEFLLVADRKRLGLLDTRQHLMALEQARVLNEPEHEE